MTDKQRQTQDNLVGNWKSNDPLIEVIITSSHFELKANDEQVKFDIGNRLWLTDNYYWLNASKSYVVLGAGKEELVLAKFKNEQTSEIEEGSIINLKRDF